jgi:hypothetical protein
LNREIEKIFKGLCKRFNRANVRAERSYHFDLGEGESWTVSLTREACSVSRGGGEGADVYFRGEAELFLDVWNGRRELGPTDFLAGRVKSNNPFLLKDFVQAFQKSPK